jgi:predicted DCC family thiol-disulfide oxidoreductase YuxK
MYYNDQKITVLFDSKCSLCRSYKKILQRLDVNKLIHFTDFREVERKYKLKIENLAKEIHLVTQEGKVYKGYFAVKYILLRIKFLFPVKVFLKFTITDNFGVWVYRQVSRNRSGINFCRSSSASGC